MARVAHVGDGTSQHSASGRSASRHARGPVGTGQRLGCMVGTALMCERAQFEQRSGMGAHWGGNWSMGRAVCM
jgi:hypothetical protein